MLGVICLYLHYIVLLPGVPENKVLLSVEIFVDEYL
jgi:hypothetical protein